MADNPQPAYAIFPKINENYQFPPEVRQALATSPELQAAFDQHTEGPQNIIDGGGP